MAQLVASIRVFTQGEFKRPVQPSPKKRNRRCSSSGCIFAVTWDKEGGFCCYACKDSGCTSHGPRCSQKPFVVEVEDAEEEEEDHPERKPAATFSHFVLLKSFFFHMVTAAGSLALKNYDASLEAPPAPALA